VLEGAQAGLSWLTILRKREAYRAAFSGFDPTRVARYSSRHIERLLGNPGSSETVSSSNPRSAMPGRGSTW